MANEKKQRTSHLRWIPIALMTVSANAQQAYREQRSAQIAAAFDLEALGFPVISYRDGKYYIVDGQHRIGALKLMGWGDQQIQCEFYEGLTEAEEAELFLNRSQRKALSAFDRFRIGITAGRAEELDIERTVRVNDLHLGRGGDGIGSVESLRRVYHRCGSDGLGRTLRIIRDAYGDAGFETSVIDGLGHVCARYNGQLDDSLAITNLSKAHGGVNGLRAAADTLRRQTGNQQMHCVAASAVEIINRGVRGPKRLPDWWKSES